MTPPIKWQLTMAASNQTALPLRQLLQREWLLPRRVVHYLRVNKRVLVAGKYLPMNFAVQPQQPITLQFDGSEFVTPKSNYDADVSVQVSLLFENRDLVVVNKPAGYKTHPNAPGERNTVLNFVQAQLQGEQQHGFAPAAYMVHRLDQATSGALIVAKNPVVVPILARQIAQGTIKREYVALVHGQMKAKRGIITLPIGRDVTDQRKRQVNGSNAQPAHTEFQVLAASPKYSVVYLRLKTGRTHQLRVHLAACGHPICGDPLYAPPSEHGLWLHGLRQHLVLPFTQRHLVIQAPLPQAMRSAWQKIAPLTLPPL